MTPRILPVIAFVLVLFVSLQCKKDQEEAHPELIALDSALQGNWQLEYIFEPNGTEYYNYQGSDYLTMRIENKKASIYSHDSVIVSEGYKLEIKEHITPGATRECLLYKRTPNTAAEYDIVRINGDSLYLYPLNAVDGNTTVYSRKK